MKRSPAIVNKTKSNKTKLIVLGFVIVTLLIFLACFVITARNNARTFLCRACIYQLCFAIRDYQDLHEKYPCYTSQDGNPLWSWRFVMQEPQRTNSNNYHRDDLWNTEHNLQTLSQIDIDRWFVCPFNITKDNRASYVAVTGKGTAWTEISNGNVKYPEETCRDMILIIETTEPRNHWAEPGDDVSPADVIRLFQADPGLVKNSKLPFLRKGHWPKHFATVGGSIKTFSDIKSLEELRRRLIVPDEYLLNLNNSLEEHSESVMKLDIEDKASN